MYSKIQPCNCKTCTEIQKLEKNQLQSTFELFKPKSGILEQPVP